MAYCDTPTTETLQRDLSLNGETVGHRLGTALCRVTYYYRYPSGEIPGIRQILRHKDLPEYTRDMEIEPPFRPE